MRYVNKPISRATARENLKSALKDVGLNTKDYGLHNRRSGEATEAANPCINNILFKKHGSWNSEKVKDGMLTKIYTCYY